MSGTADPHEPPCAPAFQYDVSHTPNVVMLGGPDRIYDDDAADPHWRPRPVGFVQTVREPLLWDGDQA